MAFNESNVLFGTRRIALHELSVSIFADVEVPTDAEVSTWVNGEFEADTWDNVILTYNPPSYASLPTDQSTYKYVWLINYDRSLGITINTRFKNGNATGGSGGGSGNTWRVLTTTVDPLVGVDGDLAIFLNGSDPKHGNIYQKIAGNWSIVSNIEGPAGAAANMSIGTVTTVSSATPASASVTGSSPNFQLNLSIPQGADAATPDLDIGTVTTLASGASATANIGGTYPSWILDLGIPEGTDGVSPGDPNLSPGTVTTLNAGDPATANIGGTYPNWTLNLGIPQGIEGDPGVPGSTPANPNLSIGSVTTLNPGDPASANIGGTYPNWTLSMGIPEGVAGADGLDGGSFTVNTTSANVAWGSVNAYDSNKGTITLPSSGAVVGNNILINIINAMSSGALSIDYNGNVAFGSTPLPATIMFGESITIVSIASGQISFFSNYKP